MFGVFQQHVTEMVVAPFFSPILHSYFLLDSLVSQFSDLSLNYFKLFTTAQRGKRNAVYMDRLRYGYNTVRICASYNTV